jgi:alpha,alpha-trehalase
MIRKNRPVYIEEYEELFVDIQTRKVLADQKTFVDSEPRSPVREILDEYRRVREDKDFDLAVFVKKHFDLPEEGPSPGKINGSSLNVQDHLHRLWDVLTKDPEESRGTLMGLPEKCVVPGGRFREVFYWDSYFTMLGLEVSGRFDLIEKMIMNFACLIDNYGFVPNGNRTYFLTRSQPPFFSLMLELLAAEKGQQLLVEYLPQLEKEYSFWMRDAEKLDAENPASGHSVRMEGGEWLNRYWDSANKPRPEGYLSDLTTAKKAGPGRPEIFRDLRAGAESGWDFSSRWFEDGINLYTIRTTQIVPIDLNCLLLHLERTLESAWKLSGDHSNASVYYQRGLKREAAIQKYLWDEEEKIFGDFDFVNNRPTRAASIGMVYPLVMKIATYKQVAKIVVQLTGKFLQPGGLLSTLVNSGEQWDAPNGWAPMQWMGFRGVSNYGYHALAEKISGSWTANVERVFRATGKMNEKYNVVDVSLEAGGGEYPNQDGFGWTNGVYLKFKNLK